MRYIYEVAHKSRPSDKTQLKSIVDVMKFTGLSTWSIYENLREGHRIKGWIITRTPIPKKEKPLKEPVNYGVVVSFPHGITYCFKSQRKCAKDLGVCASTVLHHLKNGKPDSKGRFYDYPA